MQLNCKVYYTHSRLVHLTAGPNNIMSFCLLFLKRLGRDSLLRCIASIANTRGNKVPDGRGRGTQLQTTIVTGKEDTLQSCVS